MISLWIENINQIGNFTFLNSKNGICCSVACNEFPSHRTFATRVAVLSTWSLLSIHFLLLWSIKQQAFHHFRLQCKIFIENRILNASIASHHEILLCVLLIIILMVKFCPNCPILSKLPKLSNSIQVAQIVQLCPKLANSVQMEFFWKFISRLDWRFQSCFHSMNVFRGNCLSNNICFLSYISVNYTALLYFQMYPQKHVTSKENLRLVPFWVYWYRGDHKKSMNDNVYPDSRRIQRTNTCQYPQIHLRSLYCEFICLRIVFWKLRRRLA